MNINLVCPICGTEDWKYNEKGKYRCSGCEAVYATEDMFPEENDAFVKTEWSDDDIEVALESLEVEVDEESIKYWRSFLESESNLRRILEAVCSAGNDVIQGIIQEKNHEGDEINERSF